MNASSRFWPRAIIHVDMNAFFASVEQRDFPELRGKPVGVTNGEVGTTLITCSYEARAFGVKTGMRVYEARRLCPGLIQRPARPKVYAAVSTRIMHALVDISPDMEVFSVDEAFLDVTHCQRLHGSPEHIAQLARRRIHDISGGLPCSIGVAGNKSTAKIASDLKKPNGLTLIPPWEARERLDGIPMEKLCGLGPHIAEFLSLVRRAYLRRCRAPAADGAGAPLRCDRKISVAGLPGPGHGPGSARCRAAPIHRPRQGVAAPYPVGARRRGLPAAHVREGGGAPAPL